MSVLKPGKRMIIHENLRPLTEEEMDELAVITEADIEKAKAFVGRVSPFARKLLEARLEEDANANP